MNRDQMLQRLQAQTSWDLVVLGGGATGLGTALDSASRGLRTLLLEQDDFCKGTSSRSTKLIHGGLRYLRQGNVSLVRDALRERGRLMRNAPHVVKPLGLILPCFRWWERSYYRVGVKLYDLLAGSRGISRSRAVTSRQVAALAPTLESRSLKGGVLFYDGQFDDARLAVSLLKTAAEQGACLVNYARGRALNHRNGRLAGVLVQDILTGQELEVEAKTLINATGVFVDDVRRLDDSGSEPMVVASQGAHLVLDRSFLPGPAGVLIPKTSDGRVIFFLPWKGVTLVGTTDLPVQQRPLEPRPMREEIDFLLEHSSRYLSRSPRRQDVLSAFAGLRPLVASGSTRNTSALARDHTLVVSPSGMVTITGGKWTTYRKMAEDAVDEAVRQAGLEQRPSLTARLPLHGCGASPDESDWPDYGSDAEMMKQLVENDPILNQPIHPELPIRAVELVWAVRQEMACRLEDALSRRTRALLLNARAAIESAPAAARLMAQELGRSPRWEQEEVERFRAMAAGYLP